MAEKEYIEKQEALNAICKSCDRQHPYDKENCPQKLAGCMEFYNVFELPAADVEPVRHGKWIKLGVHHGMEQYKCSKCNVACYVPEIMGEPMYEGCPICRAKMDGGNKNG